MPADINNVSACAFTFIKLAKTIKDCDRNNFMYT